MWDFNTYSQGGSGWETRVSGCYYHSMICTYHTQSREGFWFCQLLQCCTWWNTTIKSTSQLHFAASGYPPLQSALVRSSHSRYPSGIDHFRHDECPYSHSYECPAQVRRQSLIFTKFNFKTWAFSFKRARCKDERFNRMIGSSKLCHYAAIFIGGWW